MAVRELAATLLAAGTLITGSAVALTGPAFAAGHAKSSPAAAKRVLTNALKNHTIVKPGKVRVSAVTPKLACSYKFVCGQAANGHSFAYSKCDVGYQLPNLVGGGSLNNNQTKGTTAYFYDKNANFLFSSVAPEQRNVNWTPVWYAVACVS